MPARTAGPFHYPMRPLGPGSRTTTSRSFRVVARSRAPVPTLADPPADPASLEARHAALVKANAELSHTVRLLRLSLRLILEDAERD